LPKSGYGEAPRPNVAFVFIAYERPDAANAARRRLRWRRRGHSQGSGEARGV